MKRRRILSGTPSPKTTTTTEQPDVITIGDSDDEDEKILIADEEEINAESFLWNSEKKPIKAENNVINKRQSFKSNSSVVHSALATINKEESVKQRTEAIKNMTKEEAQKKLVDLAFRREQLLNNLVLILTKKEERESKTSENCLSMDSGSSDHEEDIYNDFSPSRLNKNDVESPQRQPPLIAADLDNPQSTKKVLIAKRRFPLAEKTPNNDKENAAPAFSASMPCVSKSPAKRLSFSPQKRSSTRNQFKQPISYKEQSTRMRKDKSELVKSPSKIEAEKYEAAVARKALDEAIQKALEIPDSEDYDPIKTVEPHRVSNIMEEIRDQFKNLYFQPDLPDNNVEVPSGQFVTENIFYLFEIPEDKVDDLTNKIQHLGGTVTNKLFEATRLIFYPTKREMPRKSLFLFATAAIGGRYLLPVGYINECMDLNKFVDVNDYSSDDYYASKVDLHKTTIAAIKMSNAYRKDYFQDGYPRFHHTNILLAVPRTQDEDVKLLLQMLGAYVQRCSESRQYLKNPLFTLCITDGKVALHDLTKLIPHTKPDNVRDILWNALKEFE